jgi:chromate transporter
MTTAPEIQPRISMLALFVMFLNIGLTSFGGSSMAWMYRQVVERRHLMDDQAFMTGLTIAQVLPGANPVNLALYLGMQIRGKTGATIAALGMVLPAFCVILLFGLLYRTYSDIPALQAILGGMAASGVGTTLAMGVTVATRFPRQTIPILIALITFVTVGILRWSMVPVVIVLIPLSIGLAWWLERRRKDVR